MTSQQTVIGAQSLIGWAIVSAGASTTTYVGIGGPDLDVLDSFTEAQSQVAIRQAGTAQSLYVRVPYGTSAVTSNVLKLRQNGADTSLGVSWGKNTSGTFADTSDTVSLAAGDLICFRSTGDAGLNGPLAAAFAFVTTSQPSTIIGSTHVTLPSASTSYFSVGGPSGTETPARVYSLETATLSNLQANVASNAASGSTPVRLRKNGSNGNQSITVAASTTGLFEDTTHTDSLTAGDLWNFSGVTGGTGSVQLSVTVKYLGAVANQVAYPTLGGGPSGDDVPQFIPPFGCYDATDSMGVFFDETAQVAASPTSFTVSLLTVLVAANNEPSGTLTVSARVNKANGNLSVSFSAGSTGAFQDTTHSDILTAGDLFCWQVTDANDFGFDGTVSALYTSRAPPTRYSQACAAAATAAGTAAEIIKRAQAAKGSATASATAARQLAKVQKGTVTPAGLVAKSLGLVRTATTAGVSRAVKVLGTAREATATAAAVLQRNLGITYLGVATPAAASATVVARIRAVFAAASPAGVFLQNVGKTVAIAAIVTPSGSIGRALSVVRLAVATGVASLQRALGLSRTAAATAVGLTARVLGIARLASAQPTGGLQVIKARVLTLLAAATATGAASRTVSAFRLGATTPPAAIARQLSKAVKGAATPPATATRAHSRFLAGVATAITSWAHTTDKVLIAMATPSATWRRAISAAMAAIATPTAAVAKLIPRSYAGGASPAGLLAKRIPRTYAGATTPIAALSRLPIKLLVAATAPIGTLQRAIAKHLVVSTSAVGLMLRRIAVTLAARSLAIGVIVHRKLRSVLGPVLSGLARGATIIGRASAATIKGSPD